MRKKKRKRKQVLALTIVVIGCLGIGVGVWLRQDSQDGKGRETKENAVQQKEPEVTMNEDGTGQVDVGGTVEDFLSWVAEGQ